MQSNTAAQPIAGQRPRLQPAIEYSEQLVECMQSRLEIAQALRQLADAQVGAAHSGDVNVTLGLISRKQTLLDQLAEITLQLQPYFDDEPEQRRWISAGRRDHCRQVADEGSRLLHETMQIEKSTLDDLARQRDAVAAQLQDGTNSILASHAYATDSLLQESALDIGDL